MIKTLTPKEATAQVPDKDIENSSIDLLDEIRDKFECIESDEYKPALEIIKKHLRWMIDTALWKLDSVTIVAPFENEDECGIKVFSEMADAGAHVLEEWGEIADELLLSEKVYIAMETVRRQKFAQGSRLSAIEKIHLVHQEFERARQTGQRAPSWSELDRLTEE